MAEDRRITLAALAVTAIVGVGAPIGTVLATNEHDRNRLRAEQAQADRVELRAVLDDAATSLYTVMAMFIAEQSHLLAYQSHAKGFENQSERKIDQLYRQYTRLAIRLGQSAPATERMFSAARMADGVQNSFTGVVQTDSRAVSAVAERQTRAFADEIRRFIDAANRVARATTQ